MTLDEFRDALDVWLDHNHDALAADYEGTGTLDQQMAHLSRVKRLAFDAGWMRCGWPERVGGLGGTTLMRAYLGEALASRDLVEPGLYSMTEVLAPTMIDYASPELAAAMVPELLRGDETWCQGFSEPGTGSNLGSLSCRAVRTDEGWRVNGQKVWTSLAQYAQRCILLTRTGTLESAHKGITALFVDMDSPGITVRPIVAMHGSEEFAEVYFDDVDVPFARTLGNEGDGWGVAMDLLPFERSTSLWHRAAFLHHRLQELVDAAPPGAIDPTRLGEVTQLLYAFRSRSRATQHRMADGGRLGPETSIDKVLLATTEQAVFDLFSEFLAPQITIGDDPDSQRWRSEFLYSRAASIYGGSAEIQRNIIARRLLDLGERPMIDGEDLELFERSLRNATETNTGATLDTALVDLGWQDAMSVDPRAAISLLFHLQGEANATSSALDLVVTSALLDPETGPTTGVVLPAICQWDPPATVEDDGLHVNGLATSGVADLDTVLVVASAGSGESAYRVPTSSLELRVVEGVDPTLGLLQVTGSAIAATEGTALSSEQWTSAVALARLAVSHELVGASRKMLALAREHALERVQFGQPISSFQAIRHRLAETLVAIEMAEAVLDAAWIDGSPNTAAMAKSVAGRGARIAVKHCQQVLAGIGFTTEHDLHLYIRRTLVLDALFGNANTLTKALGDEIIASRKLPPLLPL